jgi:hypothetical protein
MVKEAVEVVTDGSQLHMMSFLHFFGVLMHISLKKVPNTCLHWSKTNNLFRMLVVIGAMSHSRIESII